MLEHLKIKNIALIEECEIEFSNGLNIISGETGAGKSMVIDSVNFVLGERSSKDIIRKGASQAKVNALFTFECDSVRTCLYEMGIDISENIVLISRTLNEKGKSVLRVNGSIITASMLNRLSESLIDIHGQHEHQSLLNPSKHIVLLDKFSGNKLETLKQKLLAVYIKYREIICTIERLYIDEKERERRLDLLSFQINEIENAELKENEEDELFERKKILSNSDKIYNLVLQSIGLIYDGGDMYESAFDKISEALKNIEGLQKIDSEAENFYKELEQVYTELDDLSRELRKYFDNIESDPNELNYVEERLNLIYNLKRKYGSNTSEILAYCNKIKKEYHMLLKREEITSALVKEKNELKSEIEILCEEISEIRRETALKLEKQIENELSDLEMKYACFKILVEKKANFASDGWDKVEFMISANKGEEIKPMAKIASGGEISRVMLAIKSVLADVDIIDTFIFDEIDTGVSGRAAQRVAEKMSQLGKHHQIICVTHLPQIASMADNHFLIEKETDSEKTKTKILRLDKMNSVSEIARLIGGAFITKATLTAAGEMKDMAEGLKNI